MEYPPLYCQSIQGLDAKQLNTKNSTMKHLTKLCFIFALLPLFAQAQISNWEAGGFIGLAAYQGDLIKTDLYDAKEVKLAYGFMVRHHLHKNISFRFNMVRGNITGNDMRHEERESRGFRFSSPLTEFSGVVEIDFLGHLRHRNGQVKRVVSPYLFIGAGYAFLDRSNHYNENETMIDQDEIDVDKKISNNRSWFSMPIGIGVKMNVNEHLIIGVDWGARPVFTDKFDGVEMTGNANKNDWYGMGGITISYRFSKVVPTNLLKQ